MESEIARTPRKRNDYGDSFKMTPKEKQISFFNKYFIYKKIRNVDTRAIYNTMVGSSKFQEQMNKLDGEEAEIVAVQEEEENKPKAPKKLKRKLKLEPSSKDSK